MKTRLFMSATAAALALTLGACTTTDPSPSANANPAARRQSIDASVDAAMTKLYAQVPGSREMVSRSRGVLVFPGIVSAGLGVGGSYGTGALRVGGRTDGYYNSVGAAAGLIAGADSKAVYVLFLTDEALTKFRNSKGWTAGADASVTVLKAGADASLDTNTVRQPVVGYVLSNAGLMANLSIDGTKINRLDI